MAEGVERSDDMPGQRGRTGRPLSRTRIIGHRERLQERFRKGGADAHARLRAARDGAVPRHPAQRHQAARQGLLQRFGSFAEVSMRRRARCARSGRRRGRSMSSSSSGRRAASDAGRDHGASPARLLDSGARLLPAARASTTSEQFRILFLDKQNQLIADEVQQTGTVDHTPVYVREVVKRALELSATAIILVHNHPSGDPTPSRADIDMTSRSSRRRSRSASPSTITSSSAGRAMSA